MLSHLMMIFVEAVIYCRFLSLYRDVAADGENSSPCLQVPPSHSPPCVSWSHRSASCPPPSGRRWSRRSCRTTGCWRSLCSWWRRSSLSFSPPGSELNSFWVSEHEWVAFSFTFQLQSRWWWLGITEVALFFNKILNQKEFSSRIISILPE